MKNKNLSLILFITLFLLNSFTSAKSNFFTSPKNNENLEAGADYSILWVVTDSHAIVCRAIYYSNDNGVSWKLIDSANGYSGKYIWKVPKELSKNCVIKLDVYDTTGIFVSYRSPIFTIGTGEINSIKNNDKKVKKLYTVEIFGSAIKRMNSYKIESFKELNNIKSSLPSGFYNVRIKTPENRIIIKSWNIQKLR